MEVNKKGFHAKSNYIMLTNYENHSTIRKEYEEKLATYDVKWPLSRCEVERETLLELEKRLLHHDTLAVPHIYHSSVAKKNMIEMEYIEGQTIYELMSEQHAHDSDLYNDHVCADALISAHKFKTLFMFLYDLREIKVADLKKEFVEVLYKQDLIVNCMYHNKHKDRVCLAPAEQGVFCLGDLSAHNIICTPEKLYLIDFECAHFGYDGYDIGQLLGMCEVYANIFPNVYAKRIYDIIDEGFRLFVKEYHIHDAYIKLCEQWKKSFYEYYFAEITVF